MKIKHSNFFDFSGEQSLRNDFMYMNFFTDITDDEYYTFGELFEIVSEVDVDYLSGDFLYSEIGSVNKYNEVFPTLLNLETKDEDLNNQMLYKKIQKGDIQKCKENDILISKIRPNLGKLIFINDKNSDIYFTTAFICLRPKFISKILYHSLKTVFFHNILSIARQGKGYPTLNEKDLRTMKFNKKYVDILLHNQVEITSKIVSIENEIDILKQSEVVDFKVIDDIIGAYFNFEYEKFENLKQMKIYNTTFADFSKDIDTRFSAKFHRPSGDYIINELNRVCDKKIKDFVYVPIMTGKGISPKDYDENGNYGYASMAEISSWYFDDGNMKPVSDEYVKNNSSKKPNGYKDNYDTTIQKDDILMIRSGEGSIGKVAIVENEVDAIFSDFVIRIRLKDYNPQFAYYYFRTSYFQYLIEIYKKGLGNNTNIFPVVLQEFPIPNISLEEQAKIVEMIDKKISENKIIESKIHEKRLKIETIINNYETVKKSL